MNQLTVKFNQQHLTVLCRDDVDQSVVNEIFKFREYRSAENIIKNATGPIVDVGAHAGFFCLYAWALNKTVKIYALEPEHKNLVALEKNLLDNGVATVEMVPAVLAAKTETRELFLTPDNHNHSLVKPGNSVGTVPVQAYSLHDFCNQNKIAKISLLKLDIEGGEYEIFLNLPPADFTLIETVMMEYHNGVDGKKYQDLENVLRVNGFGVQRFPSHFDSDLGFFLATNKRALSS